jgi:hypothetical protein
MRAEKNQNRMSQICIELLKNTHTCTQQHAISTNSGLSRWMLHVGIPSTEMTNGTNNKNVKFLGLPVPSPGQTKRVYILIKNLRM